MRKFFNTLSEKDKRRYAAIEAQKLEYGGISYVARGLGCSRTTLHQGLIELEALPEDSTLDGRSRRPGGGRKPYEQTLEGIDEAFLDVLKNHIAGDPMDEKVRWTNLTQDEIRKRLSERHQIQVSTTVVRQLLDKHNFRRRKAQKNEP
jgi:hypothetical protein